VQLRLYGLIRQWEADTGLVRSLGPTREAHFEQEPSIGWFDRLWLDEESDASARRLDARGAVKELPLDLTGQGRENRR
jgi:hypothetical protein